MNFGCILCLLLALPCTLTIEEAQEGANGRNATIEDALELETNDSNCRCSENVCLSEDCILAASTVLSSLDRTADPCEDFYQFACGGWIQKSVTSNTDR